MLGPRMSAAATPWEAAHNAALEAVTWLQGDIQEGDCFDDQGDGNFNLFKILQRHLIGTPVALEDRFCVADEQWRHVTVSITGEDAAEGELRNERGELLDEPPDTPGGKLSIYDGNNSLVSEWGLFYRLPEAIVLRAQQGFAQDEAEAAEAAAEAATAVEAPEVGAAANEEDTQGAPGNPEQEVPVRDGEVPEDEQQVQIVDKMRVLWKEQAHTLRTREGTGDTGIAGTKVRLLGSTPATFQFVLRDDIEAFLKSGEMEILSAEADPDTLHPADVLRSRPPAAGNGHADQQRS